MNTVDRKFETKNNRVKVVSYIYLTVIMTVATPCFAGSGTKVKELISDVSGALMVEHKIPGMAIGIVKNGDISTYEFGLASKETSKKVTKKTLFEIGSVSKTFTGALASYAIVNKKMSTSDKVSSFYPNLASGPFENISVLNLATYTSGGLPLQTPSNVVSESNLMDYFKNWKPSFAPGTHRVYSNPSIALLGRVAAKSLGLDFKKALVTKVLKPLGMSDSFLAVPKSEMENYAWGYRKGKAVRMSPGVLAQQAYGIRTTVEDLTLFVRANIDGVKNDSTLDSALASMKSGHYQVGPMTQNFVWEKYPYPTKLENLLEGNSKKIIFKPYPVQRVNPSSEKGGSFLFNKTGSTNGFGTYVAFVPQKRVGVIIMANKNFPIKSRISAAHQILTGLTDLKEH